MTSKKFHNPPGWLSCVLITTTTTWDSWRPLALYSFIHPSMFTEDEGWREREREREDICQTERVDGLEGLTMGIAKRAVSGNVEVD